MKMGRFVVDSHVHGQRHAVRFSQNDEDDDGIIVYENSDQLVYNIETYEVDIALLLPAFSMTDEINVKMLEAHPEKFRACADPVQIKWAALRGDEGWTTECAVAELEEWLPKDGFVSIREFISSDPTLNRRMTWHECKEVIRSCFNLAAEYDVPIRWHPVAASGY
jgi:hypothetical protein